MPSLAKSYFPVKATLPVPLNLEGWSWKTEESGWGRQFLFGSKTQENQLPRRNCSERSGGERKPYFNVTYLEPDLLYFFTKGIPAIRNSAENWLKVPDSYPLMGTFDLWIRREYLRGIHTNEVRVSSQEGGRGWVRPNLGKFQKIPSVLTFLSSMIDYDD